MPEVLGTDVDVLEGTGLFPFPLLSLSTCRCAIIARASDLICSSDWKRRTSFVGIVILAFSEGGGRMEAWLRLDVNFPSAADQGSVIFQRSPNMMSFRPLSSLNFSKEGTSTS